MHFLRLGEEDKRSEQEIFFGYLQWTREALMRFPFSIVLWITNQLEIDISKRSPDFWSWRKGVFRFISKKTTTVKVEEISDLKLEISDRELLQLSDSDQYSVPLEDWQELVQKIERMKGEKNPSLITFYNKLGTTYKNRVEKGEALDYQTEQDQAVKYFLKSLNLSQELREKKGVEYLISITNLGSLYESRGELSQAEPLYQEALALRKDFYGDDNLEVATSLNDLAGLYHSQARYEEAEKLYLEALNIQERSLKPNDPTIANTLNYLAGTYHAQGNYEEAEKLYRDALQRQDKVLGDKKSNLANFKSNLALLYYEQGCYDEAENLFKDVLNLKKSLLVVITVRNSNAITKR